MRKITKQDIFNAAWQAFIVEEREPSVIAGDQGRSICTYDDGKGNHCAIGLVLPYEVREYADGTFSDLVSEYADLFDDEILKMNAPELDDFQQDLHDGMIGKSGKWAVDSKARRLSYIHAAIEHGLFFPV